MDPSKLSLLGQSRRTYGNTANDAGSYAAAYGCDRESFANRMRKAHVIVWTQKLPKFWSILPT